MFSSASAKSTLKIVLALLSISCAVLTSCDGIQGNLEAVEVDYLVEHFKQSGDGEGYVFVEEEVLSGISGEKTAAQAKTFEHFTAQAFEQKVIKGNGSTVVRIFYNRKEEPSFVYALYPNEGQWPDDDKETKTLTVSDDNDLKAVESAMSSLKNGGYKLTWYTDSDLQQKFEGELSLSDTELYAGWSCYSPQEVIEALSKPASYFYELDVDFNVEGEVTPETFRTMLAKAMLNSYRVSFDLSKTNGFSEVTDYNLFIDSGSTSYESLRGIALPPSVKKIGNSTFSPACNLVWVVIPESVTEIYADAFCSCQNLSSMVFEDTKHTWVLKNDEGTLHEDSISVADPVANAVRFTDARLDEELRNYHFYRNDD